MSDTNWCVISGAPSSGKTTLVEELERRGYRVIHEVARAIIETGREQGRTLEEIRSDKESFQNLVLNTKIAIESELPKDEVIFFDRAIPDSIAYFDVAGLNAKEAVAKSPRNRYKKIFLLDRLPYLKDGARTEDRQAAAILDQRLEASYSALGYEVIRIGVMPVKERLRRVIEELGKEVPLMERKVGNSVVEVSRSDLTEMDTDAIVNAANAQLILGAGVAGAIKAKGGDKIQEECHVIGGTFVGGAVITTGGDLKARHVIHAVGPRMGEGEEDEKLKNATLNSLKVADENNLASISFPAISTGIFGFPKDRCAEIMLGTVIDYLEKGETGLQRVVFCLHGASSFEIFSEALKGLQA
ncbi:MAG: AAA family ATPase [Thermodesulfobacteriota bacterium]|nr:AAA family ATPase [Thermodesulfobacteriota bacterium]